MGESFLFFAHDYQPDFLSSTLLLNPSYSVIIVTTKTRFSFHFVKTTYLLKI